nr:MAG TPA: hypothetical protein [Caudoviricetes sp.]
MTYPIFENLETGERLYFVKNLNPEYPTNWYEKCIIEYYEDPLNQEYSTEFYYMEEMDSDDEILNEACKLFNLNKENFEKLVKLTIKEKTKMKNTKKRKLNFKKLFIYYSNVFVIFSIALHPVLDYSFRLFLLFYCAVYVLWTFVDITSEAHKL